MSHLGRLAYVAIVLLGLGVAWWRLSEQNVALSEVAKTGFIFTSAVVGFFALLLISGKLLGRLFGSSEE